MKRIELIRTGVCLLPLLLAACGGLSEFRSDKVDYKSQSAKLPPLEIPPDLTKPGADDRFAVPDLNAGSKATSASEYNRDRGAQGGTVGAGKVLPDQPNARIQRSGSQRWLVVKGESDAVWSVVKQFWQEVGLKLTVELPEAGVLETDWAERREKIDDGVSRNTLSRLLGSVYSTSERDKYRTRLERGAEPGTTEIYISHRGMEEVYTTGNIVNAQTAWQPRPPDPELEAEMLRRLMTRFGVKEDVAKAEMAATAKPVLRASIVKGKDGALQLSVDDQFDRAWRRVGLALDRVGFMVEDRDRSKGTYFVRYIDSDADNKAESKGFFAKLNPFSKSEKKATPEQYRVQVNEAGALSEISVLAKDGTAEKSATADRILTLLYDQLK